MRIVLFCLPFLLLAQSLGGQGYSYVLDADKFTFVREEPSINSPVTDTVYILQVVETGVIRDGWVEVKRYGKDPGWVHGIRLRPMPVKAAGSLENHIGEYGREWLAFIAGTDLPHILVRCSWLYDDYPRYDTYAIEKYPRNETDADIPVTVIPGAEDVAVINLLTNDYIIGWRAWIPVNRILLHSARALIQDDKAQYGFILDREGKECISITPLRQHSTRSYSAAEIDSAIKVAAEFRARCAGKTPEEVNTFAFHFNNQQDHRILECLHTAYYNGDSRAEELYPLVLMTMTSDGAGAEEKESYVHTLWVQRNAGVTQLEKLERSDD